MKNSNKLYVYLGREILRLTEKELIKKGLHVRVVKDNGYSHIWEESVPFDTKHIRVVNGCRCIYCTEAPLGMIMGTSEVSFS